MMKFRVPHETSQPTLVELVERAWPEASRNDCYTIVGSGLVRVDERIVKNPRRNIDPELLVQIGDVSTEEAFGVPEGSELARGNDWVVVDKPVGMPGALSDDPMSPVAFLADVLGYDRDHFTPVWPMPTNAGGPWMCAETPEVAERIRGRIADGSLDTVWVAIVPEFGLPTGEIEHEGFSCRYAAIRLFGGLAELQLMPDSIPDDTPEDIAEKLLDLLAAQSAPALGDRERGGYMVEGGLRLRLMSLYDDADLTEGWVPPDDWLPTEPVVAQIEPAKPGQKAKGIRTFQVSAKTLEIMRDGHPWVLPDRDTAALDRFDPGEVVRLTGPAGQPGPYALVDGATEVAARFWSRDAEAAEDFHGEVELRLDEAFARRAELFRNIDTTDTFRIVHGEADGLPGLFVDRTGPLYRATLVGGTAWALRERVYEAIENLEPDAMILEVGHFEDVRSQGQLPQSRIIHHGAHYARPGDRVVGHEDGLRFWLEPWEGIDVGFFADQRDNRRRAVELARDGRSRWLNLFCHTGAYTVALVAAGAQVVSNDLSQRYLDWLDENLELNGLDLSQNRNVADDARTVVGEEEAQYNGIIVDPPTAAQSDAGFWSVKSGYEDLLTDCFRRLAPGGAMLVCRNARKRTPVLEELVRTAAKKAGAKIAAIESAPPAADYPRLPSFPEGDSFEGLWAFRQA